jgi:putrescine aminotransferase
VTLSLREADLRHHLHPYTDPTTLRGEDGGEEGAKDGTHVIVRGEGVWLTDDRGRRLLDGLAGLWCVNVGYGCERIVRAATEQMRKLSFYPSFFNTTTEPTSRLAERLAAIAPKPLTRTIFSGSGSEANETALKIIRRYQKLRGKPEKTKIVTRRLSYHGVTLATTSMTGLAACQDPFDLPLPGFLQAPAPWPYGAGSELDPEAFGCQCIEETRALFEREDPRTLAAIFVEPLQGAGGVLVPPDGYLPALRALAREHDVLFVVDEVITGFGRLGEWFASGGLHPLAPDLMTLAKGITSGYVPLGATMVSEEVAEVLSRGGTFSHGHTYSGHPVATAAALANLDVIEQDGLLAHVRDEVGPALEQGLRALGEHPAVAEVRACRAIGALELVRPDGLGADRIASLGARCGALIREEGAIVRGMRDAVAVSPPLVISRSEVDSLLGALRRGLDRLHAELGAL